MAKQFVYLLSPEFREAEFIRTGVRPGDRIMVDVDPVALTADARRGISVIEAAALSYPAGRGYSSNEPKLLPDQATLHITADDIFGGPKLVATAAVFVEYLANVDVAAILASLGTDYDLITEAKRRAAAHKETEKQKEQERRAQQEREAKERREEEERGRVAVAERAAVAVAERAAWIAAHGSDFLGCAVAAGYDCQRRYVTERAALELPGFTPDWGNKATWRSRSCPSESTLMQALALREAGHDAVVVWLTRDVDGEDLYREDAHEAIVVEGYLGSYTLIM